MPKNSDKKPSQKEEDWVIVEKPKGFPLDRGYHEGMPSEHVKYIIDRAGKAKKMDTEKAKEEKKEEIMDIPKGFPLDQAYHPAMSKKHVDDIINREKKKPTKVEKIAAKNQEKLISSAKKPTISPNTATFNFLNKPHKKTKGGRQ